MPFDKILVPTDGSENTKKAINYAIELAKLSGGTLTALYVLDPTRLSYITPGGDATRDVHDILESEGREAVEYVREAGAEAGVEVALSVKEGSPAKVVVDESAGYDVIVMGTLGRTGVSKFVMGSVAQKVIQGAVCPVMVVRSKENRSAWRRR